MIYVTGPRESKEGDCDVIMTVSRAKGIARGLSPLVLGPVDFCGVSAKNVENFWQFLKVYDEHVDKNGDPTEAYFKWRDEGFRSSWAYRYPMGKGRKPLYCFWDGRKLSYIEARKEIYIPVYYNAVIDTESYKWLQETCLKATNDVYLWDFDGYNHKKLGMSYQDVINCETRKMGHAFILAMALEGVIKKELELCQKV